MISYRKYGLSFLDPSTGTANDAGNSRRKSGMTVGGVHQYSAMGSKYLQHEGMRTSDMLKTIIIVNQNMKHLSAKQVTYLNSLLELGDRVS